MSNDHVEAGQVWKRNDGGERVHVILEMRGDRAMVAPDHEMTLDYLIDHYVCVGKLAEKSVLIRGQAPLEPTVMAAALRVRASTLHAQGQEMIDKATKLREAADIMEAK
jgi:hypothetical protein